MMKFIDRLPFINRAGKPSALAWLPILIQDPDAEGLPNRKWKPTAWILDTGCSGPGWINHPDSLDALGFPLWKVKELLRRDIPPDQVTVANGDPVPVRHMHLKLWLRSNLRAYRWWPYAIESTPGVKIRHIPEFDVDDGTGDWVLDEDKVVEFPFLFGMRQLEQSGIRVYVDAPRKRFSVWVDPWKWKLGCDLRLHQAAGRWAKALFRLRHDKVWDGQVAKVWDGRRAPPRERRAPSPGRTR